MAPENNQVGKEAELDVFENETEGYRFSYPKDWRAELRDGKAVLTSDSLGAVITATVKGEELELSYESQQGVALDELEQIGSKIKESFVITEVKPLDKDYINKRYSETLELNK